MGNRRTVLLFMQPLGKKPTATLGGFGFLSVYIIFVRDFFWFGAVFIWLAAPF
jgi:hypothetical protein